MNGRDFSASIEGTADEEGPALTRETETPSSPSPAFGRFRVVHQIGAGVLGPVFRAYDPQTDRTVAVKSFPLDLTPEQAAEFSAALAQLATLPLGHPSIVTPLASGLEGSTAYLVEDYFLAESVDVALRQYGPAPAADGLRLVAQLAGALDFAAAAGVHHGLLHARDILVAPHDVRLTGLGVVAALESVGFKTAPRRPYTAPERLAGGPWGTAADIYSLAVVAIELLTGKRPNIAGAGALPDVQGIQAADPEALTETLARALAERPDDRHPTALAFAAALKHALTGGALEVPPEAARPRKSRAGKQGQKAEGPVLPLVPPPSAVAPELAAQDEAIGVERMPPYLEEAAAPEPTPEPPARREPLPPTEPVETRRREVEEAMAYDEGKAETVPEAEPSTETPPPPAPLDLEDLDIRLDETEPATERIPVAPVPEREPVEELSLPLEPAPLAERAPVRPAAMVPDRRRTGMPLSQVAVLVIFGILLGLAGGYYFAVGRTSSPSAGQSSGAPANQATTPPQTITEPRVISPDTGQAAPQEGSLPPAATPPSNTQTPGSEAGRGAAGAQSPSAVSGGGSAVRPTAPETRSGRRTETRATKPTPRSSTQTRRGTATTRTPARTAPPARGQAFEGSLAIISRPPGALVYFDGTPVGKTPMSLSAVSAGSHVVRLQLDGYSTWSGAIQVVAGRQNRVTASLERRPGG